MLQGRRGVRELREKAQHLKSNDKKMSSASLNNSRYVVDTDRFIRNTDTGFQILLI